MATREEEHSTRGRSRLLFEMLEGHADSPVKAGWRSTGVRDALDLCRRGPGVGRLAGDRARAAALLVGVPALADANAAHTAWPGLCWLRCPVV